MDSDGGKGGEDPFEGSSKPKDVVPSEENGMPSSSQKVSNQGVAVRGNDSPDKEELLLSISDTLNTLMKSYRARDYPNKFMLNSGSFDCYFNAAGLKDEIVARDIQDITNYYVRYGTTSYESENVRQSYRENMRVLSRKYALTLSDVTAEENTVSIGQVASFNIANVAFSLDNNKDKVIGSLNGLPHALAFPGGVYLIPQDSAEWEPLTLLWKMWRVSFPQRAENPDGKTPFMTIRYFPDNDDEDELMLRALRIVPVTSNYVANKIYFILRQYQRHTLYADFEAVFSHYSPDIFQFYCNYSFKAGIEDTFINVTHFPSAFGAYESIRSMSSHLPENMPVDPIYRNKNHSFGNAEPVEEYPSTVSDSGFPKMELDNKEAFEKTLKEKIDKVKEGFKEYLDGMERNFSEIKDFENYRSVPIGGNTFQDSLKMFREYREQCLSEIQNLTSLTDALCISVCPTQPIEKISSGSSQVDASQEYVKPSENFQFLNTTGSLKRGRSVLDVDSSSNAAQCDATHGFSSKADFGVSSSMYEIQPKEQRILRESEKYSRPNVLRGLLKWGKVKDLNLSQKLEKREGIRVELATVFEHPATQKAVKQNISECVGQTPSESVAVGHMETSATENLSRLVKQRQSVIIGPPKSTPNILYNTQCSGIPSKEMGLPTPPCSPAKRTASDFDMIPEKSIFQALDKASVLAKEEETCLTDFVEVPVDARIGIRIPLKISKNMNTVEQENNMLVTINEGWGKLDEQGAERTEVYFSGDKRKVRGPMQNQPSVFDLNPCGPEQEKMDEDAGNNEDDSEFHVENSEKSMESAIEQPSSTSESSVKTARKDDDDDMLDLSSSLGSDDVISLQSKPSSADDISDMLSTPEPLPEKVVDISKWLINEGSAFERDLMAGQPLTSFAANNFSTSASRLQEAQLTEEELIAEAIKRSLLTEKDDEERRKSKKPEDDSDSKRKNALSPLKSTIVFSASHAGPHSYDEDIQIATASFLTPRNSPPKRRKDEKTTNQIKKAIRARMNK